MVSKIARSRSPVYSSNILDPEKLKVFNTRSNWRGSIQLAGHICLIGVGGYLWTTGANWLIKIPALIIYGFSLASMFATLHECCHRTAFASNRLNDLVAWGAGVLSGYNSTFYRRYHKWHHRYTQIAGKDPELEDPKPSNFKEYLVEVSSFNWWVGKFKTYYQLATRKLEKFPYIAENVRDEVVKSVRLQLAVYAGAIALSIAVGQPWFITYWLLPLAVGQPLLRLILLAEHTGCTNDNNPLTNTRTTLTWLPIKFLMWNMPFHGEHHLYPSIPFHALPQAHRELKEHFTVIDEGYVKVNQNIVRAFGQMPLQ